jgi:antitoxin component YwqK of YwqJK toxin-antitoxin module
MSEVNYAIPFGYNESYPVIVKSFIDLTKDPEWYEIDYLDKNNKPFIKEVIDCNNVLYSQYLLHGGGWDDCTLFYPNGHPKAQGKSSSMFVTGCNFKFNDGLYKEFYENGTLKYSRNDYKGVYQMFHENQKLKTEFLSHDTTGFYKQRDGLYTEYHDNGNLKIRGPQENGYFKGPYEERYKNGHLKLKGNVHIDINKHMHFNGPYEEHHENGALFLKTNDEASDVIIRNDRDCYGDRRIISGRIVVNKERNTVQERYWSGYVMPLDHEYDVAVGSDDGEISYYRTLEKDFIQLDTKPVEFNLGTIYSLTRNASELVRDTRIQEQVSQPAQLRFVQT